jgi:hypothetical protein
VWPALSFVAGIDAASVATLLGLVLDPRWFVDPVRPNRSNRLERFLGLHPYYQRAVSEGEQVGGVVAQRCALVYDCWRCGEETAYDALPSAQHFLTRRRSQSGYRGDLESSKRFLAYLRWTWIAALCVGPQKGQLFVPEHFFDCHDEVEAYNTHQKNVGRG